MGAGVHLREFKPLSTIVNHLTRLTTGQISASHPAEAALPEGRTNLWDSCCKDGSIYKDLAPDPVPWVDHSFKKSAFLIILASYM